MYFNSCVLFTGCVWDRWKRWWWRQRRGETGLGGGTTRKYAPITLMMQPNLYQIIVKYGEYGECSYCGWCGDVCTMQRFMEQVSWKIHMYYEGLDDASLLLAEGFYDDENEVIPGFKRICRSQWGTVFWIYKRFDWRILCSIFMRRRIGSCQLSQQILAKWVNCEAVGREEIENLGSFGLKILGIKKYFVHLQDG